MTQPDAAAKEIETRIRNGHARRMGPTENFFSIWQRQKMYKNFALVAHFNKDVKSQKQLLFKALRSILLRYPILLSTVHKTDYSDLSKPRPVHDYIKIHDSLTFDQLFVELPPRFFELPDNAERLKFINTEVHWPYETDDLLWKLAFIDSKTLVFISNHCLSDGISARNFFDDLITFFNNPENTTDDVLKDEDVGKQHLFNYNRDHEVLPKLPPSLDSIVSYTPTILYGLEYMCNLFVIRKICYQSKKVASRDDTFHYRHINITNEEIENMKKALASQNTKSKLKLTSYIQAMWLRAINEVVTPVTNPILGFHDISVPGDARVFIPPSTDSDVFRYGANACGFHKFFYPVKKVTWGLINQFNEYLQYLHRTRRFLYNMGILCLDVIARNTNMDQSLTQTLMGTPRSGTLMSNIGLYNETSDSDGQGFKINDLFFAQNAGASSLTFCVSIASTKVGGMNAVIAVTEDDISSEDLDCLVSCFKKCLSSYNELE